jgi:hypothetical protein
MLGQAAWIFAVPPFRGSDEFDHAFRAAGVAEGQWHLDEAAAHGRGLLVWVPARLQQAASAQCASLAYTGHDNCHPVAERDGQVQVATAAGGYDPTYYWVVGTAAKPFQGATALYAMRVATALFTAVLLGVGAGVFALVGVGRWATLGVVAALTPQVFYSSVVAAPNGPEVCLGFVVWACLLALVRGTLPARTERVVLGLGVAAAVPLAFMRFLGPLWIVCIVLSVLVLHGRGPVWALIVRRRRELSAGAVLVGLATCWWAAWLVLSHHYRTPPGVVPEGGQRPDLKLVLDVPLWILQMIGSFPYKDQPAPPWTYPLALFVIGLLTVLACRGVAGRLEARRMRWVVVAVPVLPLVVAAAFMPSVGAVWQGRYELPFVIGILPVCGLILDERRFAPKGHTLLAVTCLIAIGVCQVASVVHVMRMELVRSVSTQHSGWTHPSDIAVGALSLASCLVLAVMTLDARAE